MVLAKMGPSVEVGAGWMGVGMNCSAYRNRREEKFLDTDGRR